MRVDARKHSRNAVALDVAHPKGERHAARLRRKALAFMRALKLSNSELSLALVTDAAIRSLNRSWRKKNEATDVLSFPAGKLPLNMPGRRPLGDIVISLDTAQRVSRQLGVPLDIELTRYLAHGLLHLLGHDHMTPTEAKRMRKLENQLLGAEGLIGEGVHGE